MADDDWRYRKAQQLGLIDTRPFGTPGDGRAPAAPPPPRPEWTRPVSAAPAGANIPRPRTAAPQAPADGPRRLAFAGGTAMALLVAAGAGWLLNDAVGQREIAEFPPPVVEAARPAMQASETPAPAIGASVPAADAPAPDPAPLAVETAPPPVAAPPIQAPAPVPAVVRPSARAAAPPKPKAVVQRRGRGPSFNCSRARTADSRMICASRELSELDRALAQSYRDAVRRAGPSAENRLDRQQSAFLNARSACQSAPCIARLYYRRLDRLDGENR